MGQNQFYPHPKSLTCCKISNKFFKNKREEKRTCLGVHTHTKKKVHWVKTHYIGHFFHTYTSCAI